MPEPLTQPPAEGTDTRDSRVSPTEPRGTFVVEGAAAFFMEDAGAFVEVAGEGEPVVLLHPDVADARFWDVAFEALSQRYRVVRYDRRGFGRSPAATAPFDPVADLHRVLRSGTDDSAHLVGCSKGGEIALDHAIVHPEAVRSLTLVSSSVSGFTPRGTPPADLLELLGMLHGLGPLEPVPDRAAELAMRVWLVGPGRIPEMVDPDLREHVRFLAREALPAMMHEPQLAARLEPPALDRLHEVLAPTLLLTGELDDPSLARLADALASGLDGARRQTVLGTGHLLPIERPDVFHELLVSFLERTDSDARAFHRPSTLRSLHAS